MAGNRKNIEDTYPLSPMQEGLLFHSLYSPESGVYITQVTCKLHNLNVSALKQAWQQVMERHSILRTAFVWKNIEKPIQIVGKQVSMPVEEEDWRNFQSQEQDRKFEEYLQMDRSRGFEFTKAPLMRLALFQLKENTYWLLWSHHHILLDGWSLRLLFKEVVTVYEGICRNKKTVLPPVRPYREYIAWLYRQDISEAENFWRKFLKGFSTPTLTGIERTESHISGKNGNYEELRIQITEETTAAVQKLARDQQLTLNTIIQGGLALLLSRYNGVNDILIGSVVSGRPAEVAGVESIPGLFVNTLPARMQIEPGEILSSWLKQLQEQQVEMRRFEYSPLMKVQEWSEVHRGLPLFKILYAFENYPANPFAASDELSLEVTDFKVIERDNYPLTILAGPGKAMNLKVIFDTGRYEKGALSRFLEHFQVLIKNMVAEPQAKIRDISMLSPQEMQLLLDGWNRTQMEYPEELSIHELFEIQAAKTPDAIALAFEDEQLTYLQLNQKANQLAHYLQKMGVGPEVLVGILTDRNAEMIVGMLGILKAGGAYVPLDPAYPPERLKFILNDTEAPVLVTQKKFVEELLSDAFFKSILRDQNCRTICLDTDREEISAEPWDNPSSAVAGRNLAYVIYTSGSTGRPKGVAIEHRNANALIQWAMSVFNPEELAGTLASTSICFDLSIFEIFVTLSSGGKIILADNALQITSLANANAVTLINTVPSAISELVRINAIPSGVKVVNLAGEPLQTSLVNDIYKQKTVEKVFDLYGPSEDTTYSTFTLRKPDAAATIGRPIANTRMYLLENYLQPVAVGIPGIIYIGGDGVTRGYLKRPDLTAEKFIPDPFGNYTGKRLYNTGDLARYFSDGNLKFLGRSDHQVKIRGYRIELGEIETVLNQLPAVADAVVVAREDTPGEKQLAAYFVPDDQAVVTISDIRDYLQQKLPEYMIPSIFIKLDALPLTPNGKVDRKALPAPGQMKTDSRDSTALPRTPLEELLVSLWSDVLKIEQPCIYDNFFEIGGHSLLATRLISRLRDTFQFEFPISVLFETPTITALAAHIERIQSRGKPDSEIPPLEPVSRGEDLPLSFSQQRLWFLDQFSLKGNFYNIPGAVKLEGELNIAALLASLKEMVRRHEVLRTSFPDIDGKPVQVISPEIQLNFSFVNLKNLNPAARETELLRLTGEIPQLPFDLSRGPLFRAVLVEIDSQEFGLLFSMHHIISDGWSLGILIRELVALYRSFSRGMQPDLPDLPVQYADYAYWQRNWLQGEVLKDQLDYWKNKLAGIPPALELPTDYPRPAVQTFRGDSVPFKLEKELTQSLKKLSQREGATLFMMLLAAFQTFLYHFSGQKDIVVGSPVAGRKHSAIEGLIGLFINTLALRTQFDESFTFRDVLQQVRQISIEAFAHPDLPFEQLVEVLHPQRALSHSPIFQVMFVLQNTPRQEFSLPGITFTPIPVQGKTAKFDLTLAMTDTSGGLVGNFEYNADLFESSTIERMVEYFKNLLQSIATDPKQKITDVQLLTQEEIHRQINEWNDTDVHYPEDKRLAALFEFQVNKTPDALALIFEGQHFTYAEVNNRTNQLAYYLQKSGVGPEVLVNICLERSPDMVIAILGVLKAGGAYVPLDPAYPPERLLYMVNDSRPAVLLTHRRLINALQNVESLKDVFGDNHRAEKLSENSHPVIVCMDELTGLLESESTAPPKNLSDEENPAYVIYTSGSTGKPKGVVVSHRAIVNHMLWLRDHFQLCESDRYLQKTAFSFDAAGTEFYAPLITGGCLILPSPGAQQDSRYLVELIQTNEITILQLVPSLLRVLLDEPDMANCHSLRRVICAGEALPAGLQKQFYEMLDAELHNFYGPTEAAIDATFWPYPHSRGREIVPIGRPISNIKIYLLSRHTGIHPVPAGISGELCIGGVGLARGYLNRPDLTAEKFIPNPFAENGKRLYRSGDLARYFSDGVIEFQGRIDHQIKLRGFRIEIGEIEATLNSHPEIRETVVLARPDANRNMRLIAYIVSDKDSQPSIRALHHYLNQKIPEYMVPSVFVFLERLPLTPNGKVDRQALPEPDTTRPEIQAEFVLPQTPVQIELARIWSQLLNVEQIGIYDNFFELGGHSLLATQLVSRIRNQLGVEIHLRNLFERPTIAGLSEILSNINSGREDEIPSIEKLERGGRGIEDLLAEINRLSDK